MIKNAVLAVVAAGGIVAMASQASAVTTTFDFTNLGNDLEWPGALEFTQDGITVTVDAKSYEDPGAVGSALVENSTSPFTGIGIASGFGLYVTYLFDNDVRIDGWVNELVSFAFNKNVVVNSITFGSVENGSAFDLFVSDAGVLEFASSGDVISPTALGFTSDLFGVGASYDRCLRSVLFVCKDIEQAAFKITSLTVSEVPLPAAGWMLIAGVGGIAAMKRRRKAA
jgi:hypothetical protein